MASKSPKLPPEPLLPAVNGTAAKRAHVHVVPAEGGWAMRVGRRIEKTFATRFDASMAAIPFARERGSRLFVHYENGEIREAGTAVTDELMLEMWKMVYDDYHANAD
jgi:hypothetical protein